MIVVRVELHSAVTGSVTEIGRMTLSNDGTGGERFGSYDVELMRRGTIDKVHNKARVERHARKSLSVWILVRKALVALEKRQ